MPNVQCGRFLVVVILAVTLSGCASTPKVYSNVDASVDFNQFQTFGFFPTLATDKANYESLESSFLKVAVAQQMQQRGFEYAADPDLLVNFYINTKEKIRSRSTPAMSAYYGWRDPFYEPWGGYGYETRIEQYTEGTLNIDVVDARRQSLVWEGSISGRITDSVLKNLEREVDGAVSDIFEAFPVQPVNEGK